MANIHLIMTGKGGVGKSVIATWIMQAANEKNRNTLGIDCDPINQTLASYKGLDTVVVNLLNDKRKIDDGRFDEIVEIIAEKSENNVEEIVVDNGASSFVTLASYLVANDAISVLSEMGHKVIIHCVVASGQAQHDTLSGLADIAEWFGNQDCKLVVWLNEYDGEIQYNGKKFIDMKVYQANKDMISAIITLENLEDELADRTVRQIISNNQTFNEAMQSKELKIMQKQRIKTIKSKYFTEIINAIFTTESINRQTAEA